MSIEKSSDVDSLTVDNIGYKYFIDVLFSPITTQTFDSKKEFISYVNDSIDHSLVRMESIKLLSDKLNYQFTIYFSSKEDLDTVIYGIRYISSDTVIDNSNGNYYPSKALINKLKNE